MVERNDRRRLITLFCPSFQVGQVRLDGAAAQHARVRRIERGDAVRLVNGVGDVAIGSAARLGKDGLTIDVEQIEQQPRPRALELVVPVADRDRMLLAAEKAVELQVTVWRPAYFARSRSVSPRGEGEKFQEKVRARMQSALEQSGGAWIPTALPEDELAAVIARVDARERVLLDVSGESLPAARWASVEALAVGPEGGLEEDEITSAREHGWRIATLGASTLRFETAIIAGAAVVRAAQLQSGSV